MPRNTRIVGNRRAATIVGAAFLAVVASIIAAPCATAVDDVVTYEIVSDTVDVVNIEYMDPQRRLLVENVPLPWRMDTAVLDGIDRAELRADWRPLARPNKWVTVRILHNGEVLCQSTLDIGNATCYGNTPHIF
jgi:hypothetical protein